MTNPPPYSPTPPHGNLGGRPGNTRDLYLTYIGALSEAARWEGLPLINNINPAPRPRSVAFPLMGSGAVGYGYDNSASAAIDAVWDFMWTDGQAQQNRQDIQEVAFVVPTNSKMSPELCIAALRRALR